MQDLIGGIHVLLARTRSTDRSAGIAVSDCELMDEGLEPDPRPCSTSAFADLEKVTGSR